MTWTKERLTELLIELVEQQEQMLEAPNEILQIQIIII
jgi:hypothetical protein